MCGIIGCVTDRDVPRDRFDAARDRMHPRGPDDAGSVFERPVHLGSRRLAILDLSPAGHMPMATADGALTVVFNGEIYNFQQLHQELAQKRRFRSRTDTEVLLHGFAVWGWEGLLQRIDGMFAFALWERHTQTLHLARDRVGKKPLYYTVQPDGLYFASTLDALVELLPARPPLEPRAIDAYLVYQAVPAPWTVYQGVHHLEPGHAATFHWPRRRWEAHRYWDVSYHDKVDISEAEAITEIDRLAARAVRQRLVSDVPVGSFLSGGVDSGIVTALMAREAGRRVEAVTLGFEDPTYDERPAARDVARHLGVDLHEEVLRPDALQHLPAILAQHGQPLADVSIVPTYFVAQAARRHVTVVLNGDGGDELFGGYARPLVAKAAQSYRRWTPQPMRSALHSTSARWPRRLGMLLADGATDARGAFRYDRALRGSADSAYTPTFRAGLSALGWDADERYGAVWDRADGVDDVDRCLYGDFKTYLPDQLLVKMDVATMAHSLEARSPLLDTALITFAARLPTSLRLPGWTTKHLLKRLAGRLLPAAELRGPKRGFVMPAAHWLAGEAAPHVHAALGGRDAAVLEYLDTDWLRGLRHADLRADRRAAQQLWTVWLLELWLRLQQGRLDATDRLDAVLRSTPAPRTSPAASPAAPATAVTVAAAAKAASTTDQVPAATGAGPGMANGLRHVPPPPPIRILQIGMEWFPETPGGLNRVFYHLAHHLPAEGVEVQSLVEELKAAPEGPAAALVGMASPETAQLKRVLTRRVAVARALEARPVDLVACHFARALWPAQSDLGDLPLIVHFHGPWALEVAAEGAANWKRALALHVERAVYRRAQRFIVLSKAFGAILERQYGVDPACIRIVPGGVDVDRFTPAGTRGDARLRLGWPVDRPTLVAVRRLVHRMGLEQLITAMGLVRARVDDVLLQIVGEGGLRPTLEAQVAALGLTDHIRFAGRVPEADLPLAYRAADLSVLPTVALEGFGLSAVESLAAGTPVVGTRVGGIPEILEPFSPQLLSDQATPEHLAEILAAGLSGARSLPTAAACAAYARSHFSWGSVAAQVREVYAESLGIAEGDQRALALS